MSKIKKYKRAIKFLWQKITRGWADDQTWSLDCSLPKYIVPRLKRFKELKVVTPYGMTDADWDTILDKMIAAFEFFGGEERWLDARKEYKKHQEGIDLFAKYYAALWW